MRSHNFGAGALALLLASAGSGVADGQSGKPRFGKPISEAEIAAWNIDVRTPDGKNLPSGKGSVADGKVLFAAQCAACHGADANGGSMYGSLVGAIGPFPPQTRVLPPGASHPSAPILLD